MADVKWIKIATGIFDNRKIRMIENMPDGDSIIVIWFKLLTLAGEINDAGLIYFTSEIPYNEQMLASQFNRPLATIQMALQTFEKFGMIEIIDNILHVSNWEKYQNIDGLDKIRQQTRERVARHREKQKLLTERNCNVTSNATVTQCNATDKNRIDKNRIDKNKEYIVQMVSYLNEKAGTNYKATTKDTVSHINARLSDGFTVDDFKTVIDKKVNEWQGTEFEKYLRPKTLFGTKFESYLNAKMTGKTCTVERDAQLDEIF